MIPQLIIHVDDERALAAMARVAAIQSGAPLLMQDIAGLMHTEVIDNFTSEGRPAWMALKPSTLANKYRKDLYTPKGNLRKGGLLRYANKIGSNKILIGRGHLMKSVTQKSSATQAIVGSNLPYARIHQEGGQTKPHIIRAKNKKALAFGGILRKLVHHPGSKIDARPYLTLGPDGGRKIESAAARYLQTLIR